MGKQLLKISYAPSTLISSNSCKFINNCLIFKRFALSNLGDGFIFRYFCTDADVDEQQFVITATEVFSYHNITDYIILYLPSCRIQDLSYTRVVVSPFIYLYISFYNFAVVTSSSNPFQVTTLPWKTVLLYPFQTFSLPQSLFCRLYFSGLSAVGLRYSPLPPNLST